MERRLALQYAPVRRRAALGALWRLDARMKRNFGGREPAIAEIKLAWWQERLASLRPDNAPAEPLLQSLASEVAGAAHAGDRLAAIPSAWRGLFVDTPWPAPAIDAYAKLRGRALIGLAADILRFDAAEPLLLAGEAQALFDLASTVPEPAGRARIVARARERFLDAGRPVWPRAARPIGMIVVLVRADTVGGVDPGEQDARAGSPRRVARMAWHAIIGR